MRSSLRLGGTPAPWTSSNWPTMVGSPAKWPLGREGYFDSTLYKKEKKKHLKILSETEFCLSQRPAVFLKKRITYG